MLKAIYLGGIPERCLACSKKLLVGDYIFVMPFLNKDGFEVCAYHRPCQLKCLGIDEAVLRAESQTND